MSLLVEEYITVAEAADLLKVSRSTLWRWIDSGRLPAYRFGQRRVLIKRGDLERLITPARGENREAMLQKERERLSHPLTHKEQKEAIAALNAAKKLKARLLERRGGKRFSDSVELIRSAREERTLELS